MSVTFHHEDDWGELDLEKAKGIVESSIRNMHELIENGGFRMPDIIIRLGSGPLTNYKLVDGKVNIYVTTKKNFWCQLSYQFSHEYLHAITLHSELMYENKCFVCNTTESRLMSEHPNMWFEEAFAELCSKIGLLNFCEAWGTKEKGSVEFEYSKCIKEYVEDIENDVFKFGPNINFKMWFETRERFLRDSSVDRDLNSQFAYGWLKPFVEDNPMIMLALPHLRVAAWKKTNASFFEHLKIWAECCPSNSASKDAVRQLILYLSLM